MSRLLLRWASLIAGCMVASIAGCDFDDPSALRRFPVPTGLVEEGQCMCSVCWDRPFCYDGASGDSFPRMAGEPCPDPYVASEEASRLDGAFLDRVRFHCIPVEGKDLDFDPAGDRCFNYRGGPHRAAFGNVETCSDVPQCARLPSLEAFRNCTETAEPPFCPRFDYGQVQLACGDTDDGSGRLDPSVGRVRAREKLLDLCAFHGRGVPSGDAPARYCFAACAELPDCLEDALGGDCDNTCDPVRFDPPSVTQGAFLVTLDPESSATIRVSFDGEVESATMPVAGVVAFDGASCQPGPDLPASFACNAFLPYIQLSALSSVEMFDLRFSQMVLRNVQPILDDARTDGSVTTFRLAESPLGENEIYITAHIEDTGRRAHTFRTSELHPIEGAIDWATRRFVVDAILVRADRSASLHLSLSGNIESVPPVANAGPDQTLACTGPSGARATLSGLGSTDADGTDDITSYVWATGDGPNRRFLNGATVTTDVPIGETTFVLTVTDRQGSSDTDRVTVRVEDTGPPTFESVSLSTDCLWPPDHRMHLFRLGDEITTAASGTCGGPADVRIVEIRSNQPADATGDGSTDPDVLFGSAAFCVRAERAGNRREDREYTVVLEAGSGPTATRHTVVVRVPHDQRPSDRCDTGHLAPAVDDDDPRCVANAPERAAASTSCASSLGAPPSPTGMLLLLVPVVVAVRRRRRRKP
ncbi:MAG: PKD domain-containing protein [Deltaproteobacteria bacterium]|nr:PKD domain-containing protein [Deltaproteobacteria bacterium]